MLFIMAVKLLVLLTMCEAMTMKQIKSTGKMMRKQCQPKNNVEDEKIDPLSEGIFLDEKEVKCYMACIMKMANTMKNGKINYEAAMKQADLLLPEDIKEPTKEALTACRKAVAVPVAVMAITPLPLSKYTEAQHNLARFNGCAQGRLRCRVLFGQMHIRL